jgi:hypothetical protein
LITIVRFFLQTVFGKKGSLHEFWNPARRERPWLLAQAGASQQLLPFGTSYGLKFQAGTSVADAVLQHAEPGPSFCDFTTTEEEQTVQLVSKEESDDEIHDSTGTFFVVRCSGRFYLGMWESRAHQPTGQSL